MALDSGSEEEPEELFPDTGKRESTSNHETKKEREEKLRKMMEDDDGILVSNWHCVGIVTDSEVDEEMPDAAESPEEEQAPTIDQPPKEEEVKEQVTVVGGRRRGRRQVMKKKTVKDEEGYLGMYSCSQSCCGTESHHFYSDRRGTSLGVILRG